MKFGKSTIKNFFRVKELSIDLSIYGLCQVIGYNKDTGKSNETGKSTIFNALCWCLFGKYPGMVKSVINPLFPDEECEVTVEVIKNEDRLIIKRTAQNTGKSIAHRLSLYKNGEPSNETSLDKVDGNESGKAIGKTNDKIASCLGISYETFIRSHYLAQTNIKPFGEMTDRELKQYFLSNLLNIEWTEQSLKKVKEEAKELNDKLIKLNTLLEMFNVKEKEYEKNYQNWKDQERTWALQQQQTIENLESEITKHETEKSELLDKISQSRKEINELESNKTNITELKKRCEVKKGEILNIEKKINACEVGISGFKKAIAYVFNEEKAPEGKRCGVCGNLATKESLKHLKEDQNKRLNEYEKEISELSKLLVVHRLKYKEMDSELKSDLSGIVLLEEQENARNRKLESLRAYVKYNTTDNLDEKISNLQKQIGENTIKQSPYKQQIEDVIEKIEENKTNIQTANQKQTNIQNELKKVEFWKTGFSSKGIQSFLLESVTPIINNRIKIYMDELSDHRIKVYFTTVTKLKSGEYREKFGLVIKNKDGGEGYGSLSGGAKRRCDLACALALSDFQRQLSNNKLDFLCLDEVTSYLDSYWEEKFLDMISKYYKQCFIISHKENLKNSLFSSRIVLKKERGITYLEEQI